nr:phage tail spike protein [Thalassobacillus sp. CUG 92003]
MLAYLENAYAISVERRANEVWSASFSMPIDDEKTENCQHYNFVEIYGDATGRYYGLYRIMPTRTKRSDNGGSIEYECDHVLSTLLDTVMDGYYQFTNHTTTDVLQALIDLQELDSDGVKPWKLGTVDFERYFHYSFENENGLLAPVLSIPQPFDEAFQFTFDTESYPWTLNLVRPSDALKGEIRWGKDIASFEDVSDTSELVNYIIPKGYGEGVNQLGIEEVNGGERFLKDDESISKWGKHPYIWVDRRFQIAESLLESGRSILNQRKDPLFSFETDAIDLSVLPEYAHEQRDLNDVINVVVEDKTYKARITGESISDLSDEWDVKYTIANKLDDAADIQTDLERKIRVNEAYSQGATNIDSHDYQDNADPQNPAVIRFYLPDDLVNINTLDLTYESEEFRAYAKATEGGGAIVESTSSGGSTTETTTSGGGTTATSTSGGGVSKSTLSGGSTTQTSSGGGNHTHMMFDYSGSDTSDMGKKRYYTRSSGSSGLNVAVDIETNQQGNIYTAGSSGNHSHSVSIPSHSHDFSTPNHSHNVTIPNHSHDVTIPSHTHSITLPDHTHEVKHGIYKLSETPSSIEVRVDGNLLPDSSTNGEMIDLIPYLSKDGGGRVQRGTWHEITLTPDTLARINANVVSRLFIQSRIGGNF